jgi:manganese-dependent ADP-ribose/CDP-alcohol diphosphatase
MMASDSPLFTIAVLADVQYADKDDNVPHGATIVRHYRAALSRLRRAVVEINRDASLAAVLHLGDIVDGNESDALTQADFGSVVRLFRRLRHPIRHVIGNHCLDVGRELLLRELKMECAYYCREVGSGWSLAVLDTTDVSVRGGSAELIAEAHAWLDANEELENANDWNGGVGRRQLSWLRRELEQARKSGGHIIVAGHMPLIEAAAHEMFLAFNHAEVAQLIDDYRDVVPLYICGHYHEGGYARSAAGVHHVTVEGVVEMAPGVEASHATLCVFAGGRIVIDGGTGGGVATRSLEFTPVG